VKSRAQHVAPRTPSRACPVELASPARPDQAARTGPVRVHTWAVPLADRMGWCACAVARFEAVVRDLGLDVQDVPGRAG
jgi:hypothetical protein